MVLLTRRICSGSINDVQGSIFEFIEATILCMLGRAYLLMGNKIDCPELNKLPLCACFLADRHASIDRPNICFLHLLHIGMLAQAPTMTTEIDVR
jgi:hypothetical protein